MTALGSGGRTTGGGAVTVEVDGVAESLAILTRAGANLRGLDTGNVYMANADLRYRARMLADDLARTTVAPLLRSAPAPQGAKIADTLRAKSDRMPVVIIAARNPRLSGWRPGRAGNSRWRGSIAWGVERGPASPVNRYRIPRRPGGYVLGPNKQLIADRSRDRYRGIVADALRIAGV